MRVITRSGAPFNGARNRGAAQMSVWGRILSALQNGERAALISVRAVKGSAPREVGARMLVLADGRYSGTVGGGTLEWQAMAKAQAMLAQLPDGGGVVVPFSLGPDLGQCCGGHVELLIEAFAAQDAEWIGPLGACEAAGEIFQVRAVPDARGVWCRFLDTSLSGLSGAALPAHMVQSKGASTRALAGQAPAVAGDFQEIYGESRLPVLLFGAGHIGRALALALAPLPMAVRWIDPRKDAFPGHFAANMTPVCAFDPVAEIKAAPAGSVALVMTHSHALDLEIVAAGLAGDAVHAIGLIGSHTKAARFANRLRERGLADAAMQRLICPVGRTDLGKNPAVIAASLAVFLLEMRIMAEKGQKKLDLKSNLRSSGVA